MQQEQQDFVGKGLCTGLQTDASPQSPQQLQKQTQGTKPLQARHEDCCSRKNFRILQRVHVPTRALYAGPFELGLRCMGPWDFFCTTGGGEVCLSKATNCAQGLTALRGSDQSVPEQTGRKPWDERRAHKEMCQGLPNCIPRYTNRKTKHANIHAYIHTYIHAYIHTNIHTWIHYTTVHYSTLQYITVQYSTLQYTTVHYGTYIHNITLHHITLQHITLQYRTYITNMIHKCTSYMHACIHTYIHTCITLHYSTMRYRTLQYLTLHYIALHCIT